MNQKNLVTEENAEIPETLPVLPISSAVVFPYAIIQLLIHLEKNKELFNFYHEDSIICVVTPKNRNTEKIKPKDLYKFGVAAKILDIVDAGGGALQIVLQGLCRVQ
ncbi:MAG TPA: LON peptidase substrate-binding domain-containing protein, partial [Bdellovibrionota bacterium]|nr:LON peptidase substrate-binding domain-containing protein [Bdellovibrionota bacterium]